MGTLPSAIVRVEDTATAVATGADTICIWSPVATHDDSVPRIFGDAAAALAYHGYCEGVEYAALHVNGTKKPFAFVGLPIATPGTIGSEDTTGNTGKAVTTLTPGADGILHEHDGELSVLVGGTAGTDQIVLGLSLDGGRTTKRVRLGTAVTYTVPYMGLAIGFTADTLIAGDIIHTWHGSSPLSDASGWAAARAAMAGQTRQYRSIILCGDLQDDTEAQALLDELDTYETSNDRFVYGRASVLDRLPDRAASMSVLHVATAGVVTLTFAEVGGTGDTITRAAGSFLADGFLGTDYITVTGSVTNNVTRGVLAGAAALVLTMDATDLVAEGPIATASISGVGRITFANAGDTITRTRGSWVADGFREGDLVTISGTSGGTNDVTDFEIDTVTATVLTLATGGVDADESIAADLVTIEVGQAKAAWMAATDAAFAAVTGMRLDLSAGRGRKTSPITGWAFRRPASWAASVREYQHDLHIATWRKSDGPLGYDLFDAEGTLVEWDDRVDGGAGSGARFTTFRTWSNGPVGAFIAQSLTRADENSLTSYTHNMAVIDIACTTMQRLSENAVGRSMQLNLDGTATTDALNTIQSEVNAGLELVLLTNRGEGPRASYAVWTPSATDVLNVPNALLTGVLLLNLNGTIHSVDTRVRVLSGGQS